MSAPEPRTWEVALPAGMKTLSLNGRLHWSEQRSRGYHLKEAAWAVAKGMKIPALKSASIVVEYQPPDRRRRDHENIPVAMGKHAIDGLVAAGVLRDDAPPHVTGITCRIGEQHPQGRLVLYVTEEVAP